MHYPTFNPGMVATIRVVLMNLRTDPGYLSSADCPYSADVKELFHELNREPIAVNADGEVVELDLEAQIETLIRDLDRMAATLTDKDHGEKLTYFRTKTSLIEKLVSLKERIWNIREMSDFQAKIIGFLDEICTPDQRTELMNRVRRND